MQKVVKTLLALRRNDPRRLGNLLTEHRVRKGIKWLIRHAPTGWHRNLFEPLLEENGGNRFRARDIHDNECVLALSFESRGDLANGGKYEPGYVTYATVARRYRLYATHLYGFSCSGFPKHNPLVTMTSDMLDREWERALRIGGIGLHRTRRYSHDERQLSHSHAGTDGATIS